MTADRGFADVALFSLLAELGGACIMRVKRSTQVWLDGTWQQLSTLQFPGNTHRRALGRLDLGKCSAGAVAPLAWEAGAVSIDVLPVAGAGGFPRPAGTAQAEPISGLVRACGAAGVSVTGAPSPGGC